MNLREKVENLLLVAEALAGHCPSEKEEIRVDGQIRAYREVIALMNEEKMNTGFLDDIDNPLEPLKLQNALESEILKFNYRKEHKPQDINILDYTVMYALKHCLEEQLKEMESD